MRRYLAGMLTMTALGTSVPSHAQDSKPKAELPRLGLAPAEPQVRAAPPNRPFGVPPSLSRELVLDFHGYMFLPLRVGIHQRENPGEGQSGTILHSPPLIPQDLRTFEYTAVVPEPWLQLNFTYGNSIVAGTVVLASRGFPDASGIFNPVEQLGANDAFIGVNLTEPLGTPVEIKFGAHTGRYGLMGAYDVGRYGTPLIARTNMIGETITAAFRLNEDTSLVVEQALGGQLGRPPRGLVPAGWNDFADTEVGASFVTHAHLGVKWKALQLAGHYFTAWSQDDQTDVLTPDGRISVFGGDLHVSAGRFGHLYGGVARTIATNSATVSGIIEILNSRGGPELIDEYLGPASGGDGALTTIGGQYDVSFARLAFGERYQGKSPDIVLSLFGLGTSVTSDDPVFDDTTKIKFGSLATYNMLSWLGASVRFDHVRPDAGENRQAFNIISPAILFHTGWQSQDEFVLQYSYFNYGSDVVVRTGFPPVDDPTANPDPHVLMLSGTFWW